MKEFYLDAHTAYCIDNRAHFFGSFCELNPVRFIFFVETKFVLITYYGCMNCGDHLEFKKSLIEKVIKDNKIFDLYEVNKSVNISKDLTDFRIRNKSLKKYIEQVNFIYYDNSNRSFAITTRIKYLESICNQEEINENYKEAKIFLEKNKYAWLLPELNKLYKANMLDGENELDYHLTIDQLVNSINKLTK